MIPTTGTFLSEIRKGIYPAPVYEAHFTDGTIHRMTFWSRKGKAVDAETGRAIATSSQSVKHKVFTEGFVEWNGRRMSHADALEFFPAGGQPRTAEARPSITRARAALARIEAGQVTPEAWQELRAALAA